MAKTVTPRQALKALLRARSANEKGFGRYKAYAARPRSEAGKEAEQRVHYWLDEEERNLDILERFVRQQIGS